MAEKTEKATPKKLEDARKKGQVAKPQDLPSAITFIVSVSATLGLTSFLFNQMGGLLRMTFGLATDASQNGMEQVVSGAMMHGIYVMFMASIPVLAIVSFVGVMVTFLTVGPVFSIEVFMPDIKKFNPVENLKQKFKMHTLVELIKSMIKIALACYIVFDVMFKSVPVLIRTVDLSVMGSLIVFNYFMIEVLIKLGLLFLIVAVLDFMYQKHDFAKQMMMEKFEVKQEYKNTEGDPQIKSKRRQIAQEIAYQEGPSGAVKRAKAVVTNPTHLAVALGYEREVDAAPYILIMAKDKMAEQIIKLADKYNIPVMRNIPLARKLWEEGEAYQYVPEDTYEAIAEILRWVESLQESPLEI